MGYPKLLEPNLDKIKLTINSLKNKKSPNKDNINLETFKIARAYLATQIQKLIGSIWVNEPLSNKLNIRLFLKVKRL